VPRKKISLCHESEPFNLSSIPHGEFNSTSEHHAKQGYWKPNNKKNKTKQKQGKQEKQVKSVASSLTTFEKITCRELKK